MSIEGLEPVAMVDLHVVAKTAIAPTSILDGSSVRRQERSVCVGREVRAVVEVTTDSRVPGLEPVRAATEGLCEDPGRERVVERARSHSWHRHLGRNLGLGEIFT